tara:strand:+ start:90 stop:302 length:213 start_codon:yes stop_codon:yes gene_type:complete
MNYLLKRIGLLIYGLLSIVEAVGNLTIYITHLDIIVKPLDFAMPFHFWYFDKFLKAGYISKLQDTHGQNI